MYNYLKTKQFELPCFRRKGDKKSQETDWMGNDCLIHKNRRKVISYSLNYEAWQDVSHNAPFN